MSSNTIHTVVAVIVAGIDTFDRIVSVGGVVVADDQALQVRTFAPSRVEFSHKQFSRRLESQVFVWD